MCTERLNALAMLSAEKNDTWNSSINTKLIDDSVHPKTEEWKYCIDSEIAVSYTHLDVYKRQFMWS